MLRTRIITALVLLPLALYLIFGTSARTFAWVAAVLLLVGAWEFRRLAGLAGRLAEWALPLGQAVLFAVLLTHPGAFDAAEPILAASVLAWCLMWTRLAVYRPGMPANARYRLQSALSAFAVITGGWYAVSWLRYGADGQWWLMLLLLVVWAADVGAYFTGRAFGRRKLAPLISPGKTREGLAGGLVLAIAVALAAQVAFPITALPWPWLTTLVFVTVLASVGGDLFISIHKRVVGVKDSGSIFPGHGGVLDRLDSLLAAAPVFALGKLLLETLLPAA